MQTFNTGRTYNGPQIIKYNVVSSHYDSEWSLHEHIVHMVDESRLIGYALQVTTGSKNVTDNDVLKEYDNAGNRTELTIEQWAELTAD